MYLGLFCGSLLIYVGLLCGCLVTQSCGAGAAVQVSLNVYRSLLWVSFDSYRSLMWAPCDAVLWRWGSCLHICRHGLHICRPVGMYTLYIYACLQICKHICRRDVGVGGRYPDC